MSKQYKTIKFSMDEDGIGLVVLSRPQALNALNLEMYTELDSLFDELKEDSKLRVVILTGEGDKAFAAGTDITMMAGLSVSEVGERAQLVKRAEGKIEGFPLPVIAAINGVALGGGCEVAMSCDMRIATTNAKFGQPEINLGIIPGGGGTQRLVRLIGIGRAKQLIFTGDIIDVQRAYELGLVDEVVSPEELITKAKKLASKMASKSLPILKLAKAAVNYGFNRDLDQDLQFEIDCFNACFETEDQSEGMQAFTERRKPIFKDR
jgi:enoyl-CoA hydratase